jgi:uncharacterized membrane protein
MLLIIRVVNRYFRIDYVLFKLSGFGVTYFADEQNSLRAALGVMFLLTASAHWGKLRIDLMRMVPQAFGDAGMWVTLTGVVELLIAVGLQIPHAAPIAALSAVVMLVCVFPANVKAARERLTLGGRPVPGLVPRFTIQVVYLVALTAAVWPR